MAKNFLNAISEILQLSFSQVKHLRIGIQCQNQIIIILKKEFIYLFIYYYYF